ncbi:predicted protein [Enterococcus faecium Com12]|nr:predicted protein [Enterococcus faecium Com12]
MHHTFSFVPSSPDPPAFVFIIAYYSNCATVIVLKQPRTFFILNKATEKKEVTR